MRKRTTRAGHCKVARPLTASDEGTVQRDACLGAGGFEAAQDLVPGHPDKRGRLSAAEEAPPDGLWSVASHPREWMRRVQGTESRYYRAIGSAEALMLKAADLGQQQRQWSSCGWRDTSRKRVRNAVTRG